MEAVILTNQDWVTAGALIEKCSAVDIDTIGKPWWVAAYAIKKKDGKQMPEKWFKAEGQNLPSTIIKACEQALEWRHASV